MGRKPQRLGSGLRVCYLRLFGVMEHGDAMPPCDGQLVRVHLIPRAKIRSAGGNPDSPRSWVWACGGPMGNAGHHGMLDVSKRLKLPRSAIPDRTETFARELGLEWWLDHEYGIRENQSLREPIGG